MRNLLKKFTIRTNFIVLSFCVTAFCLFSIIYSLKVLIIANIILLILMAIFMLLKNWRFFWFLIIFIIALTMCSLVNGKNSQEEINGQFSVKESFESYSILNLNFHNYILKEFQNKRQIGQRLNLTCQIGEVKKTNNVYQFNFKNFLLSKGVANELTNCTENSAHKNNFQSEFNSHITGNSDWIKSVYHNDQNDLTKSFKNLGLNFLLNANGYLISTAYFLIDRLFWRWKKYQNYKAILYLPLFFNLVLFNYPIELVRVILLLFINYLSRMFKFKIGYWNKYIMVWGVLLCVNPNWIISTGFIYSLIITLFNKTYLKLRGWSGILVNIVKWSAITIPLQIFFNYNIVFLSVLNQMILQPFLSLTFIFTLFTIWIPSISHGYEFFFNFIKYLSEILGYIKLSWNVGHINWVYLTIYFLIYWIICQNKLRFKNNKFVPVILLIYSFVCCQINNFQNCYNFIAMINVGNGNSFFLHDKNGTNIFFDIGSGVGMSTSTDENFLRYYGFNIVDAVFISHTDQDHNNNMENVAKNNIIKRIYKNDYYFRDMELNNLSIKNFQYYNEKDPNDSSQVLLINWRGQKIMFTGDLPKRIELQLVSDPEFSNNFKSKGLDFLQVPHHGSKTSSSPEFIGLIKPKICFISGMHKGRLNFPNDETIQTLDKNHCDTYSTLGKDSFRYLPMLGDNKKVEKIE